MPSVALGVIGVGASLIGASRQRDAQRDAANQQRQASLQSAQLLEEAGRLGEADIQRQAAAAAETSMQAIDAGVEPIEMFANPEAVMAAQEQIISNLPISGPIADKIRQGATEFIKSRPEFNLTAPVSRELNRQADLSVSAATPQFSQALTTAGQQGLAGITDVSQIRQRGSQRLADIAGSQATQRASALIGQSPQLAQLASGAQEARLLGDIAGQQFQTSALQSVSRLGGQLFDPKAGLLRRDEFGFSPGQDPFSAGGA